MGARQSKSRTPPCFIPRPHGPKLSGARAQLSEGSLPLKRHRKGEEDVYGKRHIWKQKNKADASVWQETMSSAQIKGVGRSGKGEALSQVPNSPEGSVQLPVGKKNKVHSATLSASEKPGHS